MQAALCGIWTLSNQVVCVVLRCTDYNNRFVIFLSRFRTKPPQLRWVFMFVLAAIAEWRSIIAFFLLRTGIKEPKWLFYNKVTIGEWLFNIKYSILNIQSFYSSLILFPVRLINTSSRLASFTCLGRSKPVATKSSIIWSGVAKAMMFPASIIATRSHKISASSM